MQKEYYNNPLSHDDFPDPSILYVANEGYYAYATHDIFSPSVDNIQVKHSWNLVDWGEAKPALAEKPVWARLCLRFWAPHVVKVDEEYRMYFSAEPDTKDGMCLAFATSDQPTAFADSGTPFHQKAGSNYEMIDPCFFADPVSGKHLLYYGSAHQPIQVVELARDGRSIVSAPLPVLYPGEGRFHKLREGAFVTYKKKWNRYYLWVSGDNTWAENSYAVSVYFSDNPVSGFTKIPGDHLILKPNEHWDSPGHNCIIQDATGNDWMFYHAVDVKDRYISHTDRFLRKMCMDRVYYSEDGWPFINGSSPCFTPQEAPVFKAI